MIINSPPFCREPLLAHCGPRAPLKAQGKMSCRRGRRRRGEQISEYTNLAHFQMSMVGGTIQRRPQHIVSRTHTRRRQWKFPDYSKEKKKDVIVFLTISFCFLFERLFDCSFYLYPLTARRRLRHKPAAPR